MAKVKQPYIPLYTGDYLKDTRSLTLAAKGAWIDLIVFMWEAPVRGVLIGTDHDFARMIGTSPEDFASILLELCLKRICDKEEIADGTYKIICRRLVRNAQISAIRSEVGSKGGSKTQAKRQAKGKQNTENDIDIDNDIEILNKKESEISLDFQDVREAILGDDIWLEGIKMTYRGQDFEQALRECYLHHSQLPNPPRALWQWRQKFNTWLSIQSNTRRNGKPNLNSKADHLADLAADFAQRHGA